MNGKKVLRDGSVGKDTDATRPDNLSLILRTHTVGR